MTDVATAPAIDAELGSVTDAVVFSMGAGRFAAALAAVAEVGRVPAVTRVPGLPGWLAGVANWRGRILPILDLRGVLGAPDGPVGPRSRLLVLGEGALTVGMVVDAVEGTTELSADVAPVPAGLPGAGGLLCGQIARDDGPVAVLDVDAVLRLRESLPRGRRSA